MDGLEEGVNNGLEDADPAAEFLAREQNNLAGLEDEIPPAPVVVTNGVDRAGSPERSSPGIPAEEPEKIKIWREEQKQRLEVKDAEEDVKKEEMRAAAKIELEEWYKGLEEQIANNRKANREASKSAEKELVADTDPMEPGTEWERIAKLCDFSPKGSKHSKDISRMRSIILQLKQNPIQKENILQ